MTDGNDEKEALQSVSSSNSSKCSVTFDDLLTVLGEFGLYQKWVYFLCSLPYVFTSMQLMGWVFIGANVAAKCRDSVDVTIGHLRNVSELVQCDAVFPNGSVSGCESGFVYDTAQIKDSVAIEFDLVSLISLI